MSQEIFEDTNSLTWNVPLFYKSFCSSSAVGPAFTVRVDGFSTTAPCSAMSLLAFELEYGRFPHPTPPSHHNTNV